jgi:hypothetical protein
VTNFTIREVTECGRAMRMMGEGASSMEEVLDIFVIIMFLRASISKEAADLFKNLSLNIKLAVLPFEKTVFAHPEKVVY